MGQLLQKARRGLSRALELISIFMGVLAIQMYILVKTH